MKFKWIDWNVEHISEHNVSPDEAEEVVIYGKKRKGKNNTKISIGQTEDGRYLLVVYVREKNGDIFVITARDLTEKEKKNWRKRYGR